MISESQRQDVAKAIADAERKTSGEIVAVIARASGTYYYVAYLYAALIALIVPAPLILWTWIPVQEIYFIQLATFAGLAAILNYEPLRFAIAPRAIKRKTAHRRAVEQFLAQNLHTKPGHTGVLLFVSEAERYVEILADSAVHGKVAAAEWSGIVKALTTRLSRDDAAEGLLEAINGIGKHLAVHFPPGAGQEPVLPNHLVMLDGR